MSKLTRSNIAYDLNLSPHKITLEYWDTTITYVFSSELYRNKFFEKLAGHRASINVSLSNRFGFAIVNDLLSDLKLYSSIEKRGFLIYKGLVKIECLNDIILDGHKLMSRN